MAFVLPRSLQRCAAGQQVRTNSVAPRAHSLQHARKQVCIPAASSPAGPAANGAQPSGRAASVVPKAVAMKPEAGTLGKRDSKYEIFTLTTWLLREEQKGTVDGELATVIASIALACKQISSLVNRAGISNLTGLDGGENFSGEDQKKLDVISNEVFCNCLRASGRTGVLASEEEDMPIAVEESYSGNYIVCFDPLDGSSNIDAGISVGSIWGVYEPSEECPIDAIDNPEKMMEQCVLNVCQPGKDLKCAGYCLYSSSTTIVLSIGHGVWGFTLDPAIGEFVLTHRDVKIPEKGKIYSFNEGNYNLWNDDLRAYMEHVKDPAAHDGKPYSARYIGSLVGDFHRTLLYGGIYGYPGDKKNPNGKLRLLYECAPMSFLAEQAGGKGTTGVVRTLEIMPEKVHQREPLFIGSKHEVELLEHFVAGKRM
uniref:fructose-bisphosphatase n=1 Tax=Dunaliella tertiolecta TaxID=3047 RepID=A0A7S3QZ19_DUNTE|mmetsp:Transcript_14034/g.37914  ORF Transcript_14034/g.37914 Transcript_14034/m.37914 type:complete len:425 (+) Transcript_14034:82-1356(+)